MNTINITEQEQKEAISFVDNLVDKTEEQIMEILYFNY